MPDDNRLPTNQSQLDIKNSIDLLSANINRTASNIPYDSNLTIKGKIDSLEQKVDDADLTKGGNIINPSSDTSLGVSQITLGNNIPVGTVGNSKGALGLFANNDKWFILEPTANPTNNNTLYLPDKTGTLALTDDITSRIGNDLCISSSKYAGSSGGTITFGGTSSGRDFILFFGETNGRSIFKFYALHNGSLNGGVNLGTQDISPTYSNNTISVAVSAWTILTVMGFTKWI